MAEQEWIIKYYFIVIIIIIITSNISVKYAHIFLKFDKIIILLLFN